MMKIHKKNRNNNQRAFSVTAITIEMLLSQSELTDKWQKYGKFMPIIILTYKSNSLLKKMKPMTKKYKILTQE